jgi:hypothetical protein
MTLKDVIEQLFAAGANADKAEATCARPSQTPPRPPAGA